MSQPMHLVSAPLSRPRFARAGGLLARAAVATACVAAVLPAQVPVNTATSTPALVITRVQVVDVGTGEVRSDQTLVMANGRIVDVGPRTRVKSPRGARVVDGTGLYAVPGLWDMHVHTSAVAMKPARPGERKDVAHNAAFVFPLFVANGVTGIRDMSGNLSLLNSWRAEIRAGRMVGPRMLITGAKLGSENPVVPGAPYPISTDEDVRTSVRLLKENGADLVKYLELPLDRTRFLLRVAREQGMPVAGHVPAWMRVADVSDAGMTSVEHLQGVLQGVTPLEDELIAETLHEFTWWGKLLQRAGLWDVERRFEDRRRRALESANDSTTQALFRRFIRNGTWQVPTLSFVRHMNGVMDPKADRDARAAYMLPFLTGLRSSWGEGDTLLALDYVKWAHRVTGQMARAGVPLLAGSDMPGSLRLPGFSLVDELEHLVSAGLTPLQSLQAATIRPADFLHARDSLGTLEQGKVADVILVRGNPLADIRQLRKLESVVLAGRYLSRSDLDQMLAQVRATVADWRSSVPPKREP